MRTSHSLSMTTPSAGEWSKRWKPASISCFKSCPCIFSWLHTNNIVSWTGQFKAEMTFFMNRTEQNLAAQKWHWFMTGQNRTWLHTWHCLWTGQNRTLLHTWHCFMNRAEQNLAAQMTLFYEQDRTELCCTNDVVLWTNRTKHGCTNNIVNEQAVQNVAVQKWHCFMNRQYRTWLHKWRCFMNKQNNIVNEQDKSELGCTNDNVLWLNYFVIVTCK